MELVFGEVNASEKDGKGAGEDDNEVICTTAGRAAESGC